ncbi:MAG TPA: HNH endonuclease, partial [Methanosarcinales archaeon]|nr:HNH endonuclease [Methanosarcinales archaeon]
GSEHPMWKGGRLEKYGYIKIWMPEHPRANNIGYVSEHMLIMEKELGRKIRKTEHIHHVDFDRGNNNPKNLWVCSDSNHKIAERSIQKLVKKLLEKDIIKFNKMGGIYEL